MNLTTEQEARTRTITDALVKLAARDVKTPIKPHKVKELILDTTTEELDAICVNLLSVHMSLSTAFQRASYKENPNAMDVMTAAICAAGIGEIIAIIVTDYPIFDREATARRSSWLAGEVRSLNIAHTAAQIFLPPGVGN